jgi:flagellar hook-basal body complex protein FliE
MNALSALGSMPLTQLQSLPQQLGKNGAIPQSELQKLTSLVSPGGQAGAAGLDLNKLTSLMPAGEASFGPSALGRPGSSTPITGTGGPDVFGNMLGQLVNETNAKGATASDAVKGLLGGKDVSLHQTMIAMEEASVSFQLMVEVRNKLLESYQELMRMQV